MCCVAWFLGDNCDRYPGYPRHGCRNVKGSFTLKPRKIQIVIGDPIDISGYTIDTVQELIDKTRQAIIANFDPEYIP